MLKVMPSAAQAELGDNDDAEGAEVDVRPDRARVPG
jgi:hypothetical protein